MGLPTYEYPSIELKFTESGQCTHCGYKYVLKEDGFVCKICNCKMLAGIEVNSNVYYHGDDSSSSRFNENNDCVREHLTMKNEEINRRNYVSIYVYPPKKFPMKSTYIKRINGICINCKNRVFNSDKICSKCKINFCHGIEFKNTVYYHGRQMTTNDDCELYSNRNSEVFDFNLLPDSDSSVNLGKRFCQTKICFFSLLALIIVISILIIASYYC